MITVDKPCNVPENSQAGVRRGEMLYIGSLYL